MRQSWGRLLTWRLAVMLLVAVGALAGFYLLVSPGAQSKDVGALAQYVPGPPSPPDSENKKCEKAKKKVQRLKDKLQAEDDAERREKLQEKLDKAKKKKKKACAKK